MELGKLIARARRERGLSQMKLAERIGVSAEAVSKWESGDYRPGQDKMDLLEEELHLSWYDDEGVQSNGRIFDEDHMSAFLKGKLDTERFPEASRALTYAKEKHSSTKPRKGPGNVPYIAHPLTMACHALAMGLEDDVLLAALLLHDIGEECGIPPSEMPFCKDVQEIVALVTKPEQGYRAKEYFDAIAGNPKACMVKCIDRCNNLSTMAMGFSPSRMAKYIKETETWYPRLLRIVKAQPEYNSAVWLLQYQIRSLLVTAKMIK